MRGSSYVPDLLNVIIVNVNGNSVEAAQLCVEPVTCRWGLRRQVLVHGIVAHGAVVAGLRLIVARRRQRVAHGVLRGRRRHHGRGRARRRAHRVRRRACSGSFLGGVEVGLLLRLADVLLVANALVAEPVGHLGDGNAALPRQLLFRLLAGVRVGEVRVEILVEDLRRLLAEVAAFATRVQET